MKCRNRLWKAKKKGQDRFKSQCSDVRVLNPDGSLKEVISIQSLPVRKNIYVIPENEDVLNDRISPEYDSWRQSIIKRDYHTCVLCGSTEWIEVHHIVRWIDDDKSRYEQNNGVCLCILCHRKHHAPDNRPFPADITKQLKEYIKSKVK